MLHGDSLQKFLYLRVARYFLVKRSVYIVSSRKQYIFRRNLHFFFACKRRMNSIKLPVVSILSLSTRKDHSTTTKTDTNRLVSLLPAVIKFNGRVSFRDKNSETTQKLKLTIKSFFCQAFETSMARISSYFRTINFTIINFNDKFPIMSVTIVQCH